MESYVLGLDLGSASIGWALVEPNKKVIDCGVRIFDPGVDLETFQKGKEGSSNNVARREARLHRRQLRRRAGRQRELFELLQRQDLLPGTPTKDSVTRHQILQKLDCDLRESWRSRLSDTGIPEPSLIYLMRKDALDRALAPFDIGRVLYHLSQRRGFKSNRREAKTDSGREKQQRQDSASEVKQQINNLAQQMIAVGARTVGEFFASHSAASLRIRKHWTDRKWFEAEFDQIWSKQAESNAILTPALKNQVHDLLFFQRKLARNEHLIGNCELEPGHKRAHMATLIAQRFRYMQKLNDLAIDRPLHPEPLTKDQRDSLLELFETHGDVSFDAIRKKLGYGKETRFNLERGGEKKLPGNRTNAAMLRAIPELWARLTAGQQDSVVHQWIEAEDDDELTHLLTTNCGFALDDAQALCSVQPEDRYSALSQLAMSKLLPRMIQGVSFKTAEAGVYGTSFSGAEVYELLPPIKKVFGSIPYPAVTRALSELRKVVNALIRTYGKPAEIRIELARDLKRNAEQRQRDSKNMRTRESERSAARMLAEAHIPQPKAREIERVLLHKEGKGLCAYCGSPIPMHQLFEGYVHVDHIIPRSLFPDDSFANKCIACKNCNDQKGNRTPFQAFGADEDGWAQILSRVKSWGNSDKLDRFCVQDLAEFDAEREDSFASRRLNDTRYISKLSARYLGLLYGGRDRRMPDGTAKRKVFASTGMLTASLRRAWGLESILREPEPAPTQRKAAKPRTDHRHHAIDAIVIALSSNAVTQRASAVAATAGYAAAERAVLKVQPPWSDFVPSIEPIVKRITVSHRPSHKLFGPLHEETNYSAPRELTVPSKGSKKPVTKRVVHVRKPVHLLSAKQISEDIVDPAVRSAVLAKLDEVGDPKKLESNHPILETRSGKQVPIFRVRVRVSTPVARIASGERERYVASAGNHHVAIFETLNKKGQRVWESPGVVSRLDAVQRKSDGENIINKSLNGADDAHYLFSLMSGDTVEMNDAKLGGRNILVARTVSDAEITFVRHTDSRKLSEMERGSDTTADLIRAQGEGKFEKLRHWNCRKVFVDVLGKVRE